MGWTVLCLARVVYIVMYRPHPQVFRALRLVFREFHGMPRRKLKGCTQPLLSHLLGSAVLLIQKSRARSGTTGVVVALLHELMEDADWTREEIAKLFGNEVARAVYFNSHMATPRLGESPRQFWVRKTQAKARKQRRLYCPPVALEVSCAEHTDSLRDTLRQLQDGIGLEKYLSHGPEENMWKFDLYGRLYQGRVSPKLFSSYCLVLERIREEVKAKAVRKRTFWPFNPVFPRKEVRCAQEEVH